MLQAVSGILLVILLGLHWVAQHYIAEGGLRTYQDVVAYLKQPLITTLEISFLVLGTGHSLLGLGAILLDLGVSLRATRLINLVFTGAFIIISWYGIDLTIEIIR